MVAVAEHEWVPKRRDVELIGRLDDNVALLPPAPILILGRGQPNSAAADVGPLYRRVENRCVSVAVDRKGAAPDAVVILTWGDGRVLFDPAHQVAGGCVAPVDSWTPR